MTATWPDGDAPRLVLLAAGASSRLGSPKALAPLPGGTPAERLIQAWPLQNAPATIITGAHHHEIYGALGSLPQAVDILHNQDWKQGRTGSLQTAIGALANLDLVVAPVDCPRIPRQVFEALLQRWLQAGSPSMGWCAPFFEDPSTGKEMYGHPILIGRDLLQEALRMGPDEPLRTLRASAKPTLGARVSHVEILEDLDTREDLERLIQEDRRSP